MRKLCQYGVASGPSCRRTRSSIARSAATGASYHSAPHTWRLPLRDRVVLPWTGRDQRDVDGVVRELGPVGRPARARRLEPVPVVALGEFRLVVSAAALVPSERAEGHHARELDHVPELLDERHLVVRPAARVVEPDPAPAIGELAQLVVGLL